MFAYVIFVFRVYKLDIMNLLLKIVVYMKEIVFQLGDLVQVLLGLILQGEFEKLYFFLKIKDFWVRDLVGKQ